MNMPTFKSPLMKYFRSLPYCFAFCFLGLFSCTENTYVYEVNEINVEPNNAEKDKIKASGQYIAILYANLFQTALSPSELVDYAELIASIGDKQVAYETIIAKFLSSPDVVIPSKSEMDSNVGQFVIDTYQRFYVRNPSQAEKTYFVNYLESRPDVTPELVYFSFATSAEYNYY